MAQIWLKLWHFPQAMAQTIALRLQWFQTLNDKVWAEQIQVPSCYNGSQRCRLIFFFINVQRGTFAGLHAAGLCLYF